MSIPTRSISLRAVTVLIQGQSVRLFQVLERAFVKYLQTRLLLCAINGALSRVVAYFTFSGYTLPIGLWVGVMQITPVLGAFIGAVPAVLMVFFSGGLEGGLPRRAVLVPHAVVRTECFTAEGRG